MAKTSPSGKMRRVLLDVERFTNDFDQPSSHAQGYNRAQHVREAVTRRRRSRGVGVGLLIEAAGFERKSGTLLGGKPEDFGERVGG